MKKILVVLLIAVIPAFAFALEFQLGGTAMYKGLVTNLETGDLPGVEDFTYGAEARLKFGLLQAAAAGLYYPDPAGDSILLMTDIGVAVDILFLRLGAGLGPNLNIALDGSPEGIPVGFNLKGAVDAQFGRFSIGAVAYYYVPSLSSIGPDLFKDSLPWFGLTAMFKLF